MKEVYMVIFDGYRGGYGSYSYLLGIYESEKEAKKATEGIPEEIRSDDTAVCIMPMTLNKTLDIYKDRWGDYHTECCLGGYSE